MSAIVAVLYLLCIVALPSFAIFALLRGRDVRVKTLYAVLSLSLWVWVVSLFTFNLPINLSETLVLGRVNFAAAIPTVTFGYSLVLAIARQRTRFASLIGIGAVLLSAASLFTPWIDAAELIRDGQHVTMYGSGFPIYVLYVVGCIGAMLWVCFKPEMRTAPKAKEQLRTVGIGISATALISLVSNALLPYAFGDYRWIHVGPISTALFLGAVAGAVVMHHLFQVHVVIRTAVIAAGLVTLSLEAYKLALDSLARLLPISNPNERSYAATLLVLIINASTQEPIRRWVSGALDRLLKARSSYALKARSNSVPGSPE